MDSRSLNLLIKHKDLLAPDKQAVARWLCESWHQDRGAIPSWLRQRYWQTFPFSLEIADAPERMVRELVLDLLSNHKHQISDRDRGAG